MVKTKTKPLLPSLREKKRYLAYEVISNYKFSDAVEISKAIYDSSKEFLGSLGTAKAGIMVLKDQFNEKLQKGVIRVNNKHVDNLRASLTLVKGIQDQNVIIRSLGASGILKKIKRHLN